MAASDPTNLPDGLPEERVDGLYGVPLEEFTARRDELAKELRQGGARERADWVKRLRKPTAAAWLVNQLARTRRREADALVESGERLTKAHERLVSGSGDPADLRAAVEREKDAVRDMVALAAGLLDADGHPPSRASLDKVEQTLQVVARDEQTRIAFAAGRLERESRATGFGPFGTGQEDGPAAGASDRKKRKSSKGTGRRGQANAKAREALKQAKAEHRKTQREVTRAEGEVEEADREANRARRRLEKVTEVLERARVEEIAAKKRVAEIEGR